jgi:nicotinamidase-related amidase
MFNLFKPETTALVLIELQRSNLARRLAPHASHDVVANSAKLANALRPRGATVVFVRALVADLLQLSPYEPLPTVAKSPLDATDLAAELPREPGDLVIAKRQWGAFVGTDLDQHLRHRGIRTIVLGGIATNFGVESTARAAFDRGYDLVFAEDATSSISAEAHYFSFRNIFVRIGRVTSVAQIIEYLQHGQA